MPSTGDGTFALLGGDRPYKWTRGPLGVSFASGRIVVETDVTANIELPISSMDVVFKVKIAAEPVINTAYSLKVQAGTRLISSESKAF